MELTIKELFSILVQFFDRLISTLVEKMSEIYEKCSMALCIFVCLTGLKNTEVMMI